MIANRVLVHLAHWTRPNVQRDVVRLLSGSGEKALGPKQRAFLLDVQRRRGSERPACTLAAVAAALITEQPRLSPAKALAPAGELPQRAPGQRPAATTKDKSGSSTLGRRAVSTKQAATTQGAAQ